MSYEVLASSIKVEIPSFSEKYYNNETTTFFLLNITNSFSKKKWQMEKQFSDFENLQKSLTSIISNVPEIEGKSLFKVSSYDMLTKRQVYLGIFINECLARKDIVSNDSFKEFLDLEKNAPELSYNTPTKLSDFDKLPLGVSNIIYLQNQKILFVAWSDSNLSSRVDAYITNVNLPWEDKSDSHISVGGFFVFRVIFDNVKGFKYEKLFAKSYPYQVSGIYYDEDGQSITIGWESGTAIIYKIQQDSEFTKYELWTEFTNHKGKITGIGIDSKTGYIYTCGNDKKFMVCEIGYIDSPTEVNESNGSYTKLILDKKHERIFLTNNIGEVDIFLTTSYPPVYCNSVATSSEGVINDVFIEYKKNYMFTVDDHGIISIIDLCNPGKEKNIKEISSFGGEKKLNTVIYDSAHNELITGDFEGRLIVWNVKTGQSVYTWEAHIKGIKSMFYDPSDRVLLTAGEDNTLKGWRLPDKWMNEEIRKFEELEARNMSDTLAMMKLQEKAKDYNSDEDSLNGWDYIPMEDE